MIKNSLWFAPVMVLLVACGPDAGGGAASGSAVAATSAKPMASAKPSAAPVASAAPSMASAAPAASGSAAPAAGAVADADIVPEMKDFLTGFKGKSTDVTAAFKKHAKAGAKDGDMGMYDMHNPKVVSMAKKDKQTCYVFDANAGMMVYTYEVCWEAGKIVAATQKGSK